VRPPHSHLAGIDQDKPVPGRPGHFRKSILTRFYDLEPWSFNVHAEPFMVGIFRPDERVWITRWESNTENEDGSRAPNDIHCHAFFSNARLFQDDGQVYTGLFTDGFTPRVELPEGFAIPVERGRRMLFAPMFNNRRPKGRKASMRLTIDYVPDSKKKRAYRPLRAFTISVVIRPDLYWVEAGRIDERTRVVEAPFKGRVHLAGAHLHPFGEYVELIRESSHKVLCTCRMQKADRLQDERLSIYSSGEGFFVQRGERLRVTTVYNNTSDEKIDAMGGMVLMYDPDGEAGS